jgi:hypothetical protein
MAASPAAAPSAREPAWRIATRTLTRGSRRFSTTRTRMPLAIVNSVGIGGVKPGSGSAGGG